MHIGSTPFCTAETHMEFIWFNDQETLPAPSVGYDEWFSAAGHDCHWSMRCSLMSFDAQKEITKPP